MPTRLFAAALLGLSSDQQLNSPGWTPALLGHHRRSRCTGVIAAAAAAGALLLTGCHISADVASSSTPDYTVTGPGTQTRSDTSSTSSGQLQLVQEPTAGYKFVEQAIGGAKVSIAMVMYELADPAAQAALIVAHHRGVTVQVILGRAFHGQQVNEATYNQLTAAGVSVHWAPTSQIVHEKSFVLDGTVAWIGTGNLTAHYYGTNPGTRDAWIRDTNPTQVKAVAATFTSDWNSPTHFGNSTSATGLVWSPGAEQQSSPTSTPPTPRWTSPVRNWPTSKSSTPSQPPPAGAWPAAL